MRVTVTGATGLIGTKLVAALSGRGDEVTVLSRDPERARARFGGGVRAVAWDPASGPAPEKALEGRDGVVHLAGEPVAQRWNDAVRARIRDSRATGTRNLVAGIAAAEPRPRVLVSASAVGYYGPHGDEPVDEATPPGSDFLAGVCVVWEREAEAAERAGPARRADPHRRRARPRRRRAREDAAVVQARRRRAGRRREAVHAVDPRRRPRRPLPRRARRRRAGAGRSTARRRSRSRTPSSRRRSGGRSTGRRSRRCRDWR